MQDWYLLTSNTRPNLTGGFESETFNDYKVDALYEVLDSDIAISVILYHSDLSNPQAIRCIIQGNTADTQLKSMERIGLFIPGTTKAGMYIFFENRYWIITGYPGNNGIYEKVVMQLCQYKLRWQNSSGEIIERWVNATSASKYDVGENGNNIIRLSSNTFTLLLPDDEESLELDGKRVFIDKRKTLPEKVYKVTRSDDILYDYGEEHGGVLSFIADKTEFNSQNDNQELRICDYRSPAPPPEPPLSDETTDLSIQISGDDVLKCGFSRSYTASFYNKAGVEIPAPTFKWNVISNFIVSKSIEGNGINLIVDDEDHIGSSFTLQVIVDSNVVAKKKIIVIGGL